LSFREFGHDASQIVLDIQSMTRRQLRYVDPKDASQLSECIIKHPACKMSGVIPKLGYLSIRILHARKKPSTSSTHRS